MADMTLLTDRARAHRMDREQFESWRQGREDSNRYELLAGEVVVTPSPTPLHQVVSVALTVLVVEILSPTTWRRDLGVKRDAYAEAGVGHYWVVAPAVPSVTVYRLGADNAYTEVSHVEGSRVARLTEPFPVELRPADLVR